MISRKLTVEKMEKVVPGGGHKWYPPMKQGRMLERLGKRLAGWEEVGGGGSL